MAQQVQWASMVNEYSSQKDIDRYSVKQVIGEPNAYPYHDDQFTAWQPQSTKGTEYIKVGFAKPQPVQQIIVVESYMPGSIAQIYIYDEKGREYRVYDNANPKQYDGGKYGNVFRLNIVPTGYNVSQLKLVLYPTFGMAFPQIDAIGISSGSTPVVPKVNTLSSLAQIPAPVNLGPNINTPYADMIPIVSPDGNTLYFARKRAPENTGVKDADDIYMSQKDKVTWGKANNIGLPLNTDDYNFVFNVSPDGNTLYVANRYDYKAEVNEVGVSKRGSTGWSKLELLQIPNMYNLNNFDCYSTNLDANILMMAIERKDSYGDMDIYVSFKTGGKWTEPMNLGSQVNTAGTEGSVFLCADNKTIYFSSNGYTGYGDFDIYVTKRLDETWKKWSKPVNMGPVINTPGRDIYFSVPANGDMAYFSSDFYPGYGLTDIFRVPLPTDAKPTPIDVSNPLVLNIGMVKVPEAALPTSSVALPKEKTEQSNPNIKPYQQTPNTIGTAYDDKIETLRKQIEQVQNNPSVTASVPKAVQQPLPPAITPPIPVAKNEELEKDIEALKGRYEQLQQEISTVDNKISPQEGVKLDPPTTKTYQTTASTDPYADKLAELKKQMESTKNNSKPQPTYAETQKNKPQPATTPSTTPVPDSKAMEPYNKKYEQINTPSYSSPDYSSTQGVKLPPTYTYTPPPPTPKPYITPTAPDYTIYEQKLEELRKSRDNKAFVSDAPKAKNIKVDTTDPNIRYQPKPVNTPAKTVNEKTVNTPQKPDLLAFDDPKTATYEQRLQQLRDELNNELQSPKNEPVRLPGSTTESISIPEATLPQKTSIPEQYYEPIVVSTPEEKNIETLQKNRNETLQQIEQVQQQKEALKVEKDDLNNDITSLSLQKQNLQKEKINLQDEQEQLLAQKQNLESERQKLNDILAQMQAEKDRLDAEKKKLEYEKQRLEQEKFNQSKDIKSLKEELDSLTKLQVSAKKNIENTLTEQKSEDWTQKPVEVGTVITLNNIYFVANASFFQDKSYNELNKVVTFLKNNANLKVEIGGHTNGLCDDDFCNDLSNRRAKEVMDYLIKNGVPAARLTYKGYGKSKNIADNISEDGRKLNQRVEIKVISK